jgi:hypothetical protein
MRKVGTNDDLCFRIHSCLHVPAVAEKEPMTRNDVAAIIIHVFNAWNNQVPQVEKRYKELLSTWEQILGDLTVEEVNGAVRTLIALDRANMPRPGTIRREALSKRLDAPPAAWEAWVKLRELGEGVNSGTQSLASVGEVHEVLRKTIIRLGGSQAFTLATNGDRQFFIEAFSQEASRWEEENYSTNG